MPGLLIEFLVVILVAALVLWVSGMLVSDPQLAKIIRIVVIVAVAIWLIYALWGLVAVSPRHRTIGEVPHVYMRS